MQKSISSGGNLGLKFGRFLVEKILNNKSVLVLLFMAVVFWFGGLEKFKKLSNPEVVSAQAGTDGNLIVNESFENTIGSEWKIDDGAMVRVNDAHTGNWGLGVTDSLQSGPIQDITLNLNESGEGQYVFRMWIKTPDTIAVQIYLYLKDSTGAEQPRILAAQRVANLGNSRGEEWILVDGNKDLSWSGSLVEARLYTQIGNAEFYWPVEVQNQRLPHSYIVDDFGVFLDTDGDKYSNAEELVLGTNPNDKDTDDDTIDDGWELKNDLNPNSSWDVFADADSDGFTNQQEYWAATKPRDASSYPGKPANPNLTIEARAVLKYLALLPSHPTNRVMFGQHFSAGKLANSVDTDYNYNVTRLHEETGYWPALISSGYDAYDETRCWYDEDLGDQLPRMEEFDKYVLDQWQNCGLYKFKWNPCNPWESYETISGEVGNINDLLKSGTTANSRFVEQMNNIANHLINLRSKDSTLVLLIRPMNEMTGTTGWYSRLKREDYVNLWRYVYDYFTKTRGLNNILWVYEATEGSGNIIPKTYYYPGTDYLDIMGHNYYANEDGWLQPKIDLGYQFWDYPEVYVQNQTGPAIPPTEGDFDNRVVIQHIKQFAPRLSYFDYWSSAVAKVPPSTYAIVDNLYAQELLDDPWVVDRDETMCFELGGAIGETEPTLPVFDLLPGDANGDGSVNGVDYVIWLNHYNTTTTLGPSVGDFNYSGKVNGVDYVVWLNHYGSK